MAKLARLLANEDAHEHGSDSARRMPRLRTRYYAFLSYSHQDKELADWLHRELEKFRVPHSLAGRLTASGVVPRRLTPIFRDQHDLSAADDLGEEIKAALAASQFLLVLCSPASANSRWTNAEIESFKRTRPEGCVLAAVASGEPFASDMPGREEEECFPPALRFKYDRRGHRTTKRAEPLAADLRGSPEERRTGFLKLVAGMLGVGLDELVQRDTTRRHRQMAWLAAASLGGMAVTSTLAVTAIQARDAARDQRREAEGLVAFMLGDLKDKLEPIGRLDALDGVGSKVLAYYSKQDTSGLSDAALLQRARALSLMAEVAHDRGDLEAAQRLYAEALSGTAEAVRRNPGDPERLYDHGQNEFWLGDLARQRGRTAEAESAWREYKRLAAQMVAIQPDNMKWRMEDQSADANLGVLMLEQRRFAEAANSLTHSLQTLQALATADSSNGAYQKPVTEAQAWLTEALMNSGQVDAAMNMGIRNVALIEQLLARTGDVEYRQKLVPAQRTLAEIYASRGQVDEALAHARAAVDQSEILVAHEPENSRWRYFSARARIILAQTLLDAGQPQEAAAEVASAYSITQRLLAQDQNVQRWRQNLRDCLILQARISINERQPQRALEFSEKAVDASKLVSSTDVVADRFGIARAYRLTGDIRKQLGDTVGASQSWGAGLKVIPSNISEKPTETAERAMLLRRSGKVAEAMKLNSKLRAIGYRDSEIVGG